jgi:hypothetical protein
MPGESFLVLWARFLQRSSTPSLTARGGRTCFRADAQPLNRRLGERAGSLIERLRV